jgi:hypothetical protein
MYNRAAQGDKKKKKKKKKKTLYLGEHVVAMTTRSKHRGDDARYPPSVWVSTRIDTSVSTATMSDPQEQQDAADAEDHAWVIDSLVQFLSGPVWNKPIAAFIEKKSTSNCLKLIQIRLILT